MLGGCTRCCNVSTSRSVSRAEREIIPFFDLAQCARWMKVKGSKNETCTDTLELGPRVVSFVLMGCDLFM